MNGNALRMTVYIGEDDTYGGRPLYTHIVHLAHHFGLSGASVVRGIEGYGASSRIHTDRLLSLSQDLPIIVTIIDDEDKVRDFVPQVSPLVTEGLITLDAVETVHHATRAS